MTVQTVQSAEQDKGWMTSLPGAALLIMLYGLAHAGLRLVTSPNLGENDPQIALSIQDGLRWSYGTGEPPLFEWLAYGLTELLGPGALVFQILRYGFLSLTLVFVFLIARRLTGSGFWALVTVEGYALVYQISWRLHEGFTHPIVAMAAAAGLFYAFLRLRKQINFTNGMLLFLVLSTGFLSNPWFYGFLVAFLLALLTYSEARLLLRHPIVLGAYTCALIAAAPYWLADEAFWSTGVLANALNPASWFTAPLSHRMDGVVAGLIKPLLFLSPLLPILILWFWPSLRANRRELLSGDTLEIRLLWRTILLGTAGLIAVGVLVGFHRYSEHAVMPLFALGPIFLMILVQRSCPSVLRVKRFLMLCLVLMITAFGARAANLIILDPICNRCYFGIPFAGLGEVLSAEDNVNLIIAGHRRFGGNLTSFVRQDQTMVSLGWPSHLEPQAGQPALLLVQREEDIDNRLYSSATRFGFEQTAETRTITVPWNHFFRPDGYRLSTWYAVPGMITTPE